MSEEKKHQPFEYDGEEQQQVAVKRPSFWSLADDLEAYQETLAMVETDAERTEILAKIQEIGSELLKKTDSLAGVIRRMNADIAEQKAERDRYAAKARASEAALEWLRDYAVRTMVEHGHRVLKTPHNTVRVQGNGGLKPLNIQPDLVPDEYRYVTVRMSKTQWEWLAGTPDVMKPWAEILSDEPNAGIIRIALECGKEVPGCSLGERGSHLRVL